MYGKTSDGVGKPVLIDTSGRLITVPSGGKYADAVYGGNVYCASAAAGILLTTLHATCTGFCLTNPAGSGKLLSLLEVCISTSTIGAGATTIGLAANVDPAAAAVTQTTPLTVRNCLLGSSAGNVGLAASSVTLPAAPVFIRVIVNTAHATASIEGTGLVKDDVAGAIIIGQGCAVSVSYLTTAVTALCSMTWEEIDV